MSAGTRGMAFERQVLSRIPEKSNSLPDEMNTAKGGSRPVQPIMSVTLVSMSLNRSHR
jgi:hypothetical protein